MHHVALSQDPMFNVNPRNWPKIEPRGKVDANNNSSAVSRIQSSLEPRQFDELSMLLVGAGRINNNGKEGQKHIDNECPTFPMSTKQPMKE
jgi:hypothetical protein